MHYDAIYMPCAECLDAMNFPNEWERDPTMLVHVNKKTGQVITDYALSLIRNKIEGYDQE